MDSILPQGLPDRPQTTGHRPLLQVSCHQHHIVESIELCAVMGIHWVRKHLMWANGYSWFNHYQSPARHRADYRLQRSNRCIFFLQGRGLKGRGHTLDVKHAAVLSSSHYSSLVSIHCLGPKRLRRDDDDVMDGIDVCQVRLGKTVDRCLNRHDRMKASGYIHTGNIQTCNNGTHVGTYCTRTPHVLQGTKGRSHSRRLV